MTAAAIAPVRHVELTRQQLRAVLELARTGAPDVELARSLGLSVHTLRTHLKVARAAVGVSTTQELAVTVLRKLVTLSEKPDGRGQHMRLRHPSPLRSAR